MKSWPPGFSSSSCSLRSSHMNSHVCPIQRMPLKTCSQRSSRFAQSITLAPAVGAVAERAQQQRHVVMLRRLAHLEGDRDLRIERRLAAPAEVLRGVEAEAIDRRLEGSAVWQQVLAAAVGVGRTARELEPSRSLAALQPHRDTARGPAE